MTPASPRTRSSHTGSPHAGAGPAGIAAIGAVGAGLAARAALDAAPPGGRGTWERRNFAGRTVSLTGGAVAALAVVAGSLAGGVAAGGAAAAPLSTGRSSTGRSSTGRSSTGRSSTARRAGIGAAVAAVAAGASGLYDDLGEHRQGRPEGEAAPKGLRGHLGALAHGRVTTGAVKIAGIGAGALTAALLLHVGPGRPAARLVETATSTVVVAGTANLANLLDLRPGRALKATALLAAPLAAGAASATSEPGARAAGAAVPAAATLATAALCAPGDLGERTMLGDTGANALGAAAGVALAAALPLPLRALAAGAIVALTLASERVSFSAVIARTPVLAALDMAGRRA